MNEFNWKSKILHLPDKPGVYIMKDDRDEVIYVGKAASLKNRVSSYFQTRGGILPHVKRMMEAVQNLEIVLTNSESEALILENNLIKKYEPKYNVRLKDANTYPYVKITINENYPRFLITRKLEDDGSIYYGPYTDVKAIRDTLHYIRRFFPVATCISEIEVKKKRPCLEYQIKRCAAPCVDL
ncbi:MAG: GIY-YIG nuclease family protein, partial [Desulfobacterales bacterium]|nr:GIY-YIG nuclease family protein [Desulfobacterales bacterium]